MSRAGEPVVGHLLGVFLPPTANWLYEQLRVARAKSVVLTKVREREQDFPWEPVHSLDAGPSLSRLFNRAARKVLGHYPAWSRAARREGVGLLHAHFGPMGLHGLSLSRSLGVPLLTSFYGVDMWRHKRGDAGLRQRYEPLFARGAGFLAEGPAAAERLAVLGCPPDKIHIHRLGVDLARFPRVRRNANARDSKVRVLMAARFSEKKGVPYGVAAFCRVAREIPHAHLTVVGGAGRSAAEQAIAREVREIVASNGLESRVSFPGMLERAALRAAFLEHDVFLHPSVRATDGDAEGGHPVVITEAAASGLPVIATMHCDIPQIVRHGHTGWLCPERDVDALTDALREAISDEQRLAAYGSAARALVEQRYDLDTERWDNVYARFLD